MMGIPISGVSYVYGDNMSVIHNTSKPESTLKEKSNVITYHAVCKSMAIGETLTGQIRSEDNPEGLLSKIVTGNKFGHLALLVLYVINDGDT